MTDIEKAIMRILMVYSFAMRRRLASELRAAVGDGFDEAFDRLIRKGNLVPVYPEAKPGDSGRQFWTLRGYTKLTTNSMSSAP